MRVAGKFDTDNEIMVVIAIEKEPLKEPRLVDEIILNDITDEELLEIIKKELRTCTKRLDFDNYFS